MKKILSQTLSTEMLSDSVSSANLHILCVETNQQTIGQALTDLLHDTENLEEVCLFHPCYGVGIEFLTGLKCPKSTTTRLKVPYNKRIYSLTFVSPKHRNAEGELVNGPDGSDISHWRDGLVRFKLTISELRQIED